MLKLSMQMDPETKSEVEEEDQEEEEAKEVEADAEEGDEEAGEEDATEDTKEGEGEKVETQESESKEETKEKEDASTAGDDTVDEVNIIYKTFVVFNLAFDYILVIIRNDASCITVILI